MTRNRIAARPVRALVAVSAVLATAAWAPRAHGADRPLTVPTRDVDVTYAMTAPDPSGQPRSLDERVRWSPGAGLMRVDPPTPGIYFVEQMSAHHLLVVRDDERAVLLMQADGTSVAPGLAHATHFERAGTATVAGLACTEWHTEDTGGQPTTVCLTEDGVMLRAGAGGHVLVEARKVTYAPIDASVFKVPDDYRLVRPPR